MMLLKIKKLGEGLHPSETFISVETQNGPEEVAVNTEALRLGVDVRIDRQTHRLLCRLAAVRRATHTEPV